MAQDAERLAKLTKEKAEDAKKIVELEDSLAAWNITYQISTGSKN